jgi:hypothetical protein
MNRYFFPVAHKSGVYTDESGQYFHDLESARVRAATIAGELARDGSYVGCSVCIVDERGEELHRVSISSGRSKS